MKTIKYSFATIILILFFFSCNSDKKARLDKLKQEQSALSEEIKSLETQQNTAAGSVDTNQFKYVGVIEMKMRPFDHFVRVQGKLDGDQNAAVFAEVPGTVSERYVDVGQRVTRGQILAQLDDQQYRSQLAGLETQFKLANDLFEKQQRLWEQKIGSEVQYLQSKTNKESLERQLSTLKQQIDKFKLKSPINGTIEEVNIKTGQVVSPDPRLPAFRVVEFKNLKVTAEVSEAYSSRIKKGDRINVTFPDIRQSIDSKVDFVSNYINPVNRTFLIQTSLGGKEIPGLKANMIAVVEINDYHTDKALKVPMNIVETDLNGSYVYVVRPKDKYYTVSKQQVTLGNSYNGETEITNGLKEGDLVVSIGYQDLIDGDYVRFQKQKIG